MAKNNLPTVEEIIAETSKFINMKQASFQGGFKRAQALEGIDSMPGSEHDAPVPANYGDSDPEVDDGSQGPKGSFDMHEGKEEITTKHVLEVTEPALEPDKEPLVTNEADVEPKTAADLANGLLSSIKKYRNVKRAESQKLNMKIDDDLRDKTAAQKETAPKAEPAEKKAEPAEKKAEPANPKQEKIAAIKAQLSKAVLDRRAAEKKASEEQGARDALNDLMAGAYNQGVNDVLSKLAQAGIDPAMLAGGAAPAVEPAAMDGQAAMAQMTGGAPEAAPVAEPVAAPAGGEGVDVPEGSEGNEVTMEEVAEALDDAVQSGEISPEDAEALVEALVGSSEAPEAEPSEEAKEAAVKFAEAISEADDEIQQALAQQAAGAQEAQKFAEAIEEAANEIDEAEKGDSGSDDSGEGESDITPEEVQQAIEELIAEGKIDPEGGEAASEELGGADEADPEALLQAVAELVDEGQITAEDGEDILNAAIGGEE